MKVKSRVLTYFSCG